MEEQETQQRGRHQDPVLGQGQQTMGCNSLARAHAPRSTMGWGNLPWFLELSHNLQLVGCRKGLLTPTFFSRGCCIISIVFFRALRFFFNFQMQGSLGSPRTGYYTLSRPFQVGVKASLLNWSPPPARCFPPLSPQSCELIFLLNHVTEQCLSFAGHCVNVDGMSV